MGSSYFKKRVPTRTAVRRPISRPKTFSTEERAKEYAAKNKISDFVITRLSDHKFRIDKKEKE
ncbi:hypothetical protein KY333_05605 [Candidatus Woesearchaeota archaeon]|nr:hypothetical protein [Candidatus Woesearchaeota archaeon]MBW2994278.1 hypothetical protein [Candidatus Woesearchaeota archaeon]